MPSQPSPRPPTAPVRAPPSISRASVHADPILAFTRSHAALVLHFAVSVAARPPIVAERITRGNLILARRRTWILMLVRWNRLGLLAGERPCRAVDRQLSEALFRIPHTLRRLILRILVEPAAPAHATLIRGHRWVVVRPVALLVVIGASLCLFKARSACN